MGKLELHRISVVYLDGVVSQGEGMALRRVYWLLIVVILLIAGIREAYFWVMPSVTIENKSGMQIDSVVVELPSNRLSFGPVAPGEAQTIYRSLKQQDGTYKYRVAFISGVEVSGECGYATANELFTDFVLVVGTANDVSCFRLQEYG